MQNVVYNGVVYDPQNLPPGVDLDDCVPQDEWFARAKQPKQAPKRPTKSTRKQSAVEAD